MTVTNVQIYDIPAVLYGEPSDRVWLFVHGKNGYKEEAEAFAENACLGGAQVLAVDLPEHGERKTAEGFDPWRVVPELREVMVVLRQRWAHVSLRANSIGAWFSMLAFADTPPEQVLFVSPVVDMKKLIQNMMQWAAVDEARLEKEGKIPTDFGETLSWDYLQYSKAHPIEKWTAPTAILYAGQDNLTDRGTIEAFVRQFGCNLSVMENGEHWFHTPEQLTFLQAWERKQIEIKSAGRTPDIAQATSEDIDHWMQLVRRLRKRFPGLETEAALSEHRETVLRFMEENGAICAKDGDRIVGALLFSWAENRLCYLAVDDRYQRQHIAQELVGYILPLADPERDITLTTFREGEPRGVAARSFYRHMGFEAGALTEEFEGPAQVFVLRRQVL
ncbi:GNAT family N-acetyltransferase [Oscillibacter sp.]|uniref:GNAT family N-acetyltransferase n=1 Tax=Oscillibacter sp. TaxID=1945593 RepID=UPI0028AEAC38|nr:GNAT family N-acetyltransferase [Oscillibacter sp.]